MNRWRTKKREREQEYPNQALSENESSLQMCIFERTSINWKYFMNHLTILQKIVFIEIMNSINYLNFHFFLFPHIYIRSQIMMTESIFFLFISSHLWMLNAEQNKKKSWLIIILKRFSPSLNETRIFRKW